MKLSVSDAYALPILITGAQGQLARALAQTAPQGVRLLTPDRKTLNITEVGPVRSLLKLYRPQFVFNCAAYNLVDKAETDGAEDARLINSRGPAVLAALCKEQGIPLVHFSTDFVFDGQKTEPYTEEDEPHPLGVYATSKLNGEKSVLDASPKNFAIRVCRLYGPVAEQTQKPGGNFPLLMLKLGRERGKVRVVDDQIGSPTYTPDLARATWQLIEKADGGLFHLSNAGEVSFADYAEEIFAMAGVKCEVERVSTADYGAPAARPLYSTLSNAKAISAGVKPMRHYRAALAEFLATQSAFNRTMTADESLERYGLVPSDESLGAIRELLAREIELERSHGEREEDLALLCCVQLFSRGLLEDVLLIWEAKKSGFDLACYLDIQLLCGAGLEATKEYLQAKPSPLADAALGEIERSEAAGTFENWSPGNYHEHWRGYFAVA